MNIAIIGYGKMGKEIEKIAKTRGHKIVSVIDIESNKEDWENLYINADIAIEFTEPNSSEKNVMKCLENGISVVTGTTGWKPDIDQITKICNKKHIAFFKASNFSIGVNAYIYAIEKISKIFNKYSEYTVRIEETHHIHKLDKPSGTAISIADAIISNNSHYKNWSLKNGEDTENTIPIKSIRQGEVYGDHTVIWESDNDFLHFTHSAKNRKGFVHGALLAAEFINGKSGIFTMKDLLNI